MIRAYLLRERILNDLTVKIYEKSVDIGILAEEWDEVFLCVTSLVEKNYPQIQSSQKLNRFSGSSSKLVEQFENLKMDISGESDVQMQGEQIEILQRKDEIQSLLILFYLRSPNQINYLNLNKFLLQISNQMDIDQKYCNWAVKIMRNIVINDFVGYFRVLKSGSYNQQKMLKLQTQKMREKAMQILSTAYRKINVQYLFQTLQFDSIEELQEILKKFSELGSATAKTALGNLNMSITQKLLQGLNLQNKDQEDQFFNGMDLVFKQ
eukprot:TRINITY_DN5909_c0_g1_i1.p1 TRINITY_DN5909_c0_g1~~TRINITY_DN5909_c0_g1_i1.p1  ORF type:complete len:282 (-),score=34.26 TRINITY_DN5909_c0_g1_i1:696-1493(-)